MLSGEVVIGPPPQLRLLVWKREKIITVKPLPQELCADPWSSSWGNALLILKCKQSKLLKGEGEKAWKGAGLRWVCAPGQLSWFQDCWGRSREVSGVHPTPSKPGGCKQGPSAGSSLVQGRATCELGLSGMQLLLWVSLLLPPISFYAAAKIPPLISRTPWRQNTGNWIYPVLEFVRFHYKINK